MGKGSVTTRFASMFRMQMSGASVRTVEVRRNAIFSLFANLYFLFRKKKFWNAATASGDRIRSPKN
jgi:hypothetical protein